LHAVARVDFRGNLGISEDDLRRAVSDRFGALPTPGRAPEVGRTLEQQVYPDYGFLKASVRPKPIVLHDPDRTILEFDIDAGPQARVGKVEIRGNPLEPLQTFKTQVRAVEGSPFEPLAIRRGLDDFRKRLRKQKRYEASANFVPQRSEDNTVV